MDLAEHILADGLNAVGGEASCMLADLPRIDCLPVVDRAQASRWHELMRAEHSLCADRLVGARLCYWVTREHPGYQLLNHGSCREERIAPFVDRIIGGATFVEIRSSSLRRHRKHG